MKTRTCILTSARRELTDIVCALGVWDNLIQTATGDGLLDLGNAYKPTNYPSGCG